ncbi:MAG: hypothetical protein ACYTGN_04360 [Planctomycetota bacterium]|jgi:hypothetical protein
MKYAIWVLLAAGGFTSGYLVRDASAPERSTRTERTSRDLQQERSDVIASLSVDEVDAILAARLDEDTKRRLRRLEEQDLDAQAELDKEPAPEETDEQVNARLRAKLRKAFESQLPVWEASFAVNAKRAGREMALALGIEGPLVDQVAAAFEKEGKRAASAAMEMMAGDLDEDEMLAAVDSFHWFMGNAGIMSDDLSATLGGFLDDNSVGGLREEMRVRNKKQVDAQVEMQMAMMNLPDLSDTQRAELKEVFSGGGMMAEQSKVWSELMRRPRKLLEAETDEQWAKALEPAMKGNRERMGRILNPKQLEAYEKYEKTMISQGRMWLRPFLKSAGTK